ncbi:hypothetical protein AB4Z54_36095, partial [Streptomyces sp. MCAF7]
MRVVRRRVRGAGTGSSAGVASAGVASSAAEADSAAETTVSAVSGEPAGAVALRVARRRVRGAGTGSSADAEADAEADAASADTLSRSLDWAAGMAGLAVWAASSLSVPAGGPAGREAARRRRGGRVSL